MKSPACFGALDIDSRRWRQPHKQQRSECTAVPTQKKQKQISKTSGRDVALPQNTPVLNGGDTSASVGMSECRNVGVQEARGAWRTRKTMAALAFTIPHRTGSFLKGGIPLSGEKRRWEGRESFVSFVLRTRMSPTSCLLSFLVNVKDK
ncbi:uncharacterized protein SPSK_05650 [Sporothrix schenckii 1099-18]|uniref:Uncharacterized protein n=1 Tax=Sporothrix schenckii 1099-18 TaxID=1397361 RepID=A0A0F2LTT5_SPOSC|nr:uncharacterized protein SPSK_05650 [Sporothrix schenckii 1099-18]KJR80892.1 hypothetical protein SPSK_05650 [Sporothrix schenckii 1099-18]